LLRKYGIAFPSGILVHSPQQARAAVAAYGGKAMLKGQVLTGGRGKAGIVKPVYSEEQSELVAQRIFEKTVKGYPVRMILVTEFLDIKAEYYAAVTIEPGNKEIVLIVSRSGGMDIEDIASKNPELIKTITLFGPETERGREEMSEWLASILEDKAIHEGVADMTWNMYKLFRDKDCSLVEINPLAVTAEGLVAADAKIVFDDNAVSRHPELAALQNPEEYTEDELDARNAGLSFVSLDGDIGCMVNGAGLAMATVDCIKLQGGRPANFLDMGGSSNPDKVVNSIRILLKNKNLKAILINIIGGITRCDDIAQGIISAREDFNIRLPLVIRLIGTEEEKARKMLRDAGLPALRDMPEAIKAVVEYAAKGVPQ
jgi:succinyl-CoA synthetase beta subunit